MRSSNPVLSGRGFARINPDVLNDRPNNLRDIKNPDTRPSVAPMSIEDVVLKSAMLFGVLALVGAFAWNANNPFLAMVGLFGGLILALVNSFSKKVRPPLVIAYAAAQGLALGSISRIYETAYDGIVTQAIIATGCAFGGVLLAYRSGRIRVTPKFTRVMMGGLIGYLVFTVVTLFTGRPSGGLGLLISVAAVGLASMFIVMDLDQIEKGVAARLPHEESWRMAFGLMVTLVWLYLEILRLISVLRGDE
ncbi:MAG: hypothetical protein F2531_00880 [Actinobacteria bacterium]|uniref:Unannotated protein n=1 Tax=freshwater metagenome TaxID=449393 RepID=A0A6J6BDD9_9ZZZZ|nr:hypothetical protein [Actinomycetota bacterium]